MDKYSKSSLPKLMSKCSNTKTSWFSDKSSRVSIVSRHIKSDAGRLRKSRDRIVEMSRLEQRKVHKIVPKRFISPIKKPSKLNLFEEIALEQKRYLSPDPNKEFGHKFIKDNLMKNSK